MRKYLNKYSIFSTSILLSVLPFGLLPFFNFGSEAYIIPENIGNLYYLIVVFSAIYILVLGTVYYFGLTFIIKTDALRTIVTIILTSIVMLAILFFEKRLDDVHLNKFGTFISGKLIKKEIYNKSSNLLCEFQYKGKKYFCRESFPLSDSKDLNIGDTILMISVSKINPRIFQTDFNFEQ